MLLAEEALAVLGGEFGYDLGIRKVGNDFSRMLLL
jgi:hypothetical protein